jgi:YHS domain-containing protein
MIRVALFIIFVFVIARAFWRLVDGVVEGISQADRRSRGEVPQRGVSMVRDPVCGTFLTPDGALSIADGRERVYFCSTACRDKYRKGASGRPESVGGRTA